MKTTRESSVFRRAVLLSLILACLTALAFGRTSACGIDWHPPTSHFDGVDDCGHVSYWQILAPVVLDDKTVIPLLFGFNSKFTSSSTLLGAGWSVPLLESKVVQSDEDKFIVTQPNGSAFTFNRIHGDDLLVGPGGWKGIIHNDSITVWADCGWKLTFVHGKISSIGTPTGSQLTYVYEDGRVTEIMEGSATKLRVNYYPDGREFVIGSLLVKASFGYRPVIAAKDKNVPVGLERTLAKIEGGPSDGAEYTFDVNDELMPRFRVEERNGLVQTKVWDPASLAIVEDNDAVYKIKSNGSPNNSDILKVRKSGGEEFWSNNEETGKTVERNTAGVTVTTTRFLDGPCAGRVRKRERSQNGHTTTIYKADYDAGGHLIREVSEGLVTTYATTSPWLVEKIMRDGKVVYFNFNLPVEASTHVEP